MKDADRGFRGQPREHWLRVRTTGDDEQRWEAIDAIRHICAPEESIPLLLDTLRNDSYARARGLAAHALFDLAIDRSFQDCWPLLVQALPALRTALTDPDQGVQDEISKVIELLESPPIQDE